jgi:hypothetical protein
MSTSLFARSLARRAVERTVRAKVAPYMGTVRFTSYYTPGEFGSVRVSHPFLSLMSLLDSDLFFFL